VSASRFRLRSEGRGRNYSRARGLIESILRVAYRGDWPAAAWGRLPGTCRVGCVRQRLEVLPRGASALRVGFVSDIHIGPTTPPELLAAAFGRLAGERLDVLLLGGDYVFLDATESKAEVLSTLVRSVPASHKLAVLGNHDLWTRHDIIERALARAGVRVLCNESVLLDAATGPLAVMGLDEPWTGALDADRAVAGIGQARAVVVLCHSPDGLPDAVRVVGRLPAGPVGLYVCGHTHGGHVSTPWGPLVVPGRLGKRYPHGSHRVPPLHVHVSRGVGGIEVPIRTYAAPEVAVFELIASD
jgi:predicted MPP superfamily phosphohydrolase